jgi:hypothetical protein
MLRMRSIFTVGITLLISLSLVLVGCGSSSAATPSTTPPATAQYKHIFYIMMENHATNEIIGNTADAPYINQLAGQYGVAMSYYGVTHPSLPNYLAAFSGNFQGIWDDCKADASVTCAPQEFGPDASYTNKMELLTPDEIASATHKAHMFDGQNLVDQLEAHHLTWKAYMQSMPSVGFTGEYAPVDTVQEQAVPRKLYAVKHNPFFYFTDIRNTPARMQLVVPFTQFAQDITSSNVPNFVWISPDQCNDMHGITTTNAMAASVNIPDCAFPASGLDHKVIALGDKFLSATVPMIMNSPAWKDNSAIVIAWDEDDYAGDTGCCKSPTGVSGATLGGANAPAIIITSKGPNHIVVSDTSYNHYSLLGTIEKLWGLGCLANTCGFSDAQLMTRFFP